MKKFLCVFLIALAGCVFQRTDDAAYAQKHMVGMTKEQVLMCMGPAKRAARLNDSDTDVWSYASTSGTSSSYGVSTRANSQSYGYGMHEKNSCTVNVVMKKGIVTKIQYLGPRGGMLTPDEQCAYAIEHCVD